MGRENYPINMKDCDPPWWGIFTCICFSFLSVIIWHGDEQGWIHSMRTKFNSIYEDCKYGDDQMYVGKLKREKNNYK